MGNSQFLTIIKDKKINIDQSLLNCSSSKLRQYYSSYKSICQSFSITISQFIQIFGHNQKAFQAFDPKKKGRIDAIEMFTGLIIFSSINYQQKIKFLFQIFDFNQQGWLSYEAVTFLLINACNSTYKIFSISHTVNSKQIQAFLNEYFYKQSQIGLQKFIKWSRRIQQFMIFFNIIEHDFEAYYQMKKIDKLKVQVSRQKCMQYKRQRNILQSTSNVKYQRTGDILHTFISKAILKQPTQKIINSNDNDKQKIQQINNNNINKNINNNIFDNENNKNNIIKNKLITQNNIIQNKQNKKINKNKYKINFEFDNKFIQVLENLVAPYQQNNYNQTTNKNKSRNQKQVNFNFNQEYQHQNKFIQQNQFDSELSQDNIQQQTFNPSLKWLYGINLSLPNPIKFLQTTDPKASNQIFIYTINHIVILYYHKINIQKHYIHHKNLISCFEISQNKKYIVSADYGQDFEIQFPQIHVWRIKDRKGIVKWRNVQKGKIHRLGWSKRDSNIISISYFENKWAVKIIDLLSNNILLSTYINDCCIRIQRIFNQQNSNNNNSNNNSGDNNNDYNKAVQFIEIIQCRNKNSQQKVTKVKKSQSINNNKSSYNQKSQQNKNNKQETYFIIYTYNSITYIYPNEQQQQQSTSKLSLSSQNESNHLYKQYNMITKMINYNTCNDNNQQPPIFSNINQTTKLNNIFGNNNTSNIDNTNNINNINNINNKQFPPLICLLPYQNNQFLAVHNDKKIRLWNQHFNHYSIIYQRLNNSDKPFFKIILYEQKNQLNKLNIITNNNKNINNEQSIIKQSQFRNKNNLNQYNNSQKQKTNQQSLQTNNHILLILDEQKVQLLNIRTKQTKLLQIPDTLYNLMFINMELIKTRKQQTQLILISLFGDVIRVLGLNSLLQNLLYNSNKYNKSSQLNNKNKKQYQQFSNKHSQNSNSQSQSQQQQKQGPHEQLQQQKKITYKKYYQIFYLQKCKDYYCYDQYCLILSDKYIYKINTDQKQLTTLIIFDHQLKTISGFNHYYAILTQKQSKYIYILYCDQIIQKIKLVHNISTIKLIPTHLILCSDKYIEIYTKSYQKYFTSESKRVPIQGSLPLEICSTQNPYKFIIITKQREVYNLQIKNNQFRYKKIKSNSINGQSYNNTQGYNALLMQSYLQIVYPHLSDQFAFIFYPQQKFICIGMSNGDVRVWTDIKRIKNNKQSCLEYYQLLNHQGPVKKMKLRFYQSQLQLVTLGQKDGMIAIYNHFDYLIGDKQTNNINNHKQSPSIKQQQQLFNCYLDQITLSDKQSSTNSPFNMDIYRHSANLLKDSQISITLFQQSILPFPWIHKIISKIVHPSTSNYQSLSGDYQQSRANLISLEIDHVYGFISEKIRNSVGYIHHYPNPNQQKNLFNDICQITNSNDQSNKMQSTPQQTKVSFANSTILPLNQEHENCKRQVIYFIDRLIILFNPQTRKQRVYSFHKNQVSTFQVHPNKYLVCSAQKGISNPIVHIWDAQSLVMIKSIKTRHKGGSIFKIQFSRQGTYVLTLSGYRQQQAPHLDKNTFLMTNNNYSSLGLNTNNSATRNINNMASQRLDYISVQIVQWKYSNSILYRVLLQQLIFTIKFNPYCQTQICFGGKNSLKIYSFGSGNLVIKQSLYDFDQTITALVYSSALYGTQIESDIIVGTMEGNAALYICGKLIKIKKIHDASVNFISLNQLFKYKTIVITGAEDQIVKIWDTKFNLLALLNIRAQLLIGKQLNEYLSYNFSAQSIDFYSCYPQKQTQVLNEHIFLLGTRSGHILESKITSEYQGLKSIQDKKVSFIKQRLSLQVKRLVTNNNLINGQSQFEICGIKLMITYSINSSVIFIWNYKKNELMNFNKLKGCPSVIKYDNNTNKVFIGYFKFSQVQVYIVTQDQITYYEQFAIKSDYYPDNIVFSSINNYLSLSLITLNSQTSQNTSTSSTSSCIQIYQYKQVGRINSQLSKKQYQLKYRIDHNRKRNTGSVLTFGINSCIWMEFSSSGQQLLVLYSQKRILVGPNGTSNSKFFKDQSYSTRDNYIIQTILSSQQAQKISKNSQFIMYSIPQKKQKQHQNQQFVQLNFFPFIKLNYIYYQKIKSLTNPSNSSNLLINNIQQTDLLHPLVSQMAQYQKFIIIGTSAGQILFIHSDFFCSIHKKINKNNAICKYFKLFSTPITKIIVNNDRIFVSSSKNNSVLNIRVIHSENMIISSLIKDEYNDKISEQYLQRQIKVIYPKRKYIYQSRLNFNQSNLLINQNNLNFQSQTYNHQLQQSYDTKKNIKKRINLQLYSAIGRNAIYKRNNIFVDLRENIISHTGCNLLILKKNSNNSNLISSNNNQPKVVTIEEQSKRINYNQQFLKLDVSPFSTFAQISCIAISEDKRVIFAGTNQQNAKILIWDISTKTNLKQISLNSMISIRKLGVSTSNQRIAVIALNKKGEMILFFIQITGQQILAAYYFSSEHQQINDIKFLPDSQFSFLLCGNNYMVQWKYNGILTFQHYNIQNPSDFIQMGDKNNLNSNQSNSNKNQSQVIFYSISFLKNILISAGSDGYLYIWNDKKIIKKQNAHPKSAILCLYASSSSKIFASGGADGKAIVWQLSSSSIIQKMFQFSIYHGRQPKIPIRYHIQSVCISKNNIIVGTRAGQIYEFMCNDIEEIQKLKEQWKKGINLILPAYDDDVINSISFNTSSQKLFLITQMGYFSVFDIETLQKIKQQKIDIGKSDIIKMIACKLSYRIFIVLKNSVLIYYYMYNKEQKIQKFRKGKQSFKSEQSLFIKNAIMSSNEKYLALLMASVQMDLYSIQLYDLTQAQGSFFKQYKIMDHIPTNVQVIDFSTDNEYLICKNTEDQQTIIHLSTHEMINPNTIQFELEYSDQAKKTSKNIRDILQLYGQENQLLKIAQVMNHSIIATDEMGSIRVFEYSIVGGNSIKDKQDVSYYRFYVQHLNQVYLCVLSQDCRILATVGRQDRTLFLWKVRQV